MVATRATPAVSTADQLKFTRGISPTIHKWNILTQLEVWRDTADFTLLPHELVVTATVQLYAGARAPRLSTRTG